MALPTTRRLCKSWWRRFATASYFTSFTTEAAHDACGGTAYRYNYRFIHMPITGDMILWKRILSSNFIFWWIVFGHDILFFNGGNVVYIYGLFIRIARCTRTTHLKRHVDFVSDDKFKVLQCLMNQILSYATVRDIIEEKLETLRTTKYELRQLQVRILMWKLR